MDVKISDEISLVEILDESFFFEGCNGNQGKTKYEKLSDRIYSTFRNVGTYV